MNNFKAGFAEAVGGILGAILFGAILSALKQDESIPKNYFWIFSVIGLVGTISTFWFLKTAGFIFNLGWIAAALLLKDAMDTGMFLEFLIAPIIIMVIRIILLFYNRET